MIKVFAITGVALVVTASAVFFAMSSSREHDRFASCRASAIAGGAGAIGGPFELVNSAGETVTDADVITQPTLIYFGYTFCPDVCSLDVDRNAVAVGLTKESGREAQNLFISVDPERDTPEVVGYFADHFENTAGLTGSDAQVKAASKAYRTYYRRQDSEDEFYLIDHSTQSYLVLPEHGFVEFFKRSDSPEVLAERMSCFIDAA